MFLNEGGAHGHRGQGDLPTQGMVRKTDLNAEIRGHRSHGPEVVFLAGRGVHAQAVKKGQGRIPRPANGLDRFRDLFEGSHAGAENQWPSGSSQSLQQRQVREVPGTDLEGRHPQLVEKGRAFLLEGGREEENPIRLASRLDPVEGFRTEFKLLEHLQLASLVPCVLGLVLGLGGVAGSQGLGAEGLEFDRIGARLCRHLNHLDGAIHVAVVVDARLGDDKAGMPNPHSPRPELDTPHMLGSQMMGCQS